MEYQNRDISLNYEETGKGKAVVILHGLGCDLHMMEACLEPVFAKHPDYRRIYIDLPGMGKSTGGLEHASSDKILERLLDFINFTVDDKYLLIGESYGGYLARGILSRQAERIDGLMLLCPVVEPQKDKRALPDDIIRFKDELFLEKLTAEDRDGFCEYAVIADAYTYQRYRAEIDPAFRLSDAGFISRLEKNYSFTFDVDKMIAGLDYDKPSLFICGKQDDCVGYEDLWRLLKSYSRATFAVLDAAGHNLQIEQVSVFNELVGNWLIRTEKLQVPDGLRQGDINE